LNALNEGKAEIGDSGVFSVVDYDVVGNGTIDDTTN